MPFRWNSGKDKEQAKRTYQLLSGTEVWGRGWVTRGKGNFFGEDRKFLCLDCGGGYTAVGICQDS